MKREDFLKNYRHFEAYKDFKTGENWVSKTTAGDYQWFNYERKYKNKDKWKKTKAKVKVGSDLYNNIMRINAQTEDERNLKKQ